MIQRMEDSIKLRNKEISGNGYFSAISANTIIGLAPIYFSAIAFVPPPELLAHRILWSALLLGAVFTARAKLVETVRLALDPSVFLSMAASALLIAINWGVYIIAVQNGFILAASLGNFLNPLVNVLLGVLILKERLRRLQCVALICGLIGAGSLAIFSIETLWISSTLALAFGVYALIRKTAPIGSAQGLMIETLVLTPPAIVYLSLLGNEGVVVARNSLELWGLILFSGVLTSIPLLLFGNAARKLPLITIGMLQYIIPVMQFLIGHLLYGEQLGGEKLVSFVFVWIGLAIIAVDSLRSTKRQFIRGKGVRD